ncbi:MAG: 1-(5-phosphoribosyl)-5-[(5-phosphoribosylamino)methylideneamino]imidazole-4-carboxamide isomerase [SAR202 cluster bacterium Io17-Chloro-G9]|nr:MAG: 1-(5-phosphoribosyl)-5-[(5-phosphoribosylamino)methylideneamino]imidazole-4-carboxamide isomerase [SAR202 cluster bacterium Io17-Chloro-G9]
MEVIPSIDLKAGRCVRLYQGDYQQETVYSQDPLAVALTWEELGAPRLHLVDLDGAAGGVPMNLEAITAIVHGLSIPVQVGGGIRDIETAQSLISAGAERVVIGTAAVLEPSLVQELCERYGKERVVVAVDAKDGRVAIKGWTESTTIDALGLANQMASLGVQRILYTDISRDGTLTEPNFEANATLVRDTGLLVLASGGIASLDHVRRLARTGVEGVILGRALYTQDIYLPDALTAASQLAN